MARQSSVDDQILRGMARGPWSDYWAREQEERGRSFSGQDIYDVAPTRVPRAAMNWAVAVGNQIERMNQATLGAIYDLAVRHGYPNEPEHFGVDLGLQVAGHGVSYQDDMPSGTRDLIRLPHREFYL